MSLVTVLWLFPVVFMLHDFEEIVLVETWMRRNGDEVRRRFRFARGAIDHLTDLPTAAFALVVAEEFLIISAVTLAAVELGWYEMWAGILIAFLLHLVGHLAQFLALRHYIPAIVTTLLALPYGVWALDRLAEAGLLRTDRTIVWAVLMSVAMLLNLAAMHQVARRARL